MTLVAMSLFVGACSPSNTASNAIVTTSTLSTETTMEGAVELVVSDQQLTSGTYTRSDFTPRVTFELSGAEWYAVQAAAGFFDIQRDVGSPHVIAVQFGNVEAAYGGDDERVEPASAAEAVTIVGSHAQLTVLAQDGSRTAGLEGTVVVVENASETQARIFEVPAGALAIDPGRRLWAALFDVGDGILAIMVGGSAERWDEALLAAEPILETVTIDP